MSARWRVEKNTVGPSNLRNYPARVLVQARRQLSSHAFEWHPVTPSPIHRNKRTLSSSYWLPLSNSRHFLFLQFSDVRSPNISTPGLQPFRLPWDHRPSVHYVMPKCTDRSLYFLAGIAASAEEPKWRRDQRRGGQSGLDLIELPGNMAIIRGPNNECTKSHSRLALCCAHDYVRRNSTGPKTVSVEGWGSVPTESS